MSELTYFETQMKEIALLGKPAPNTSWIPNSLFDSDLKPTRFRVMWYYITKGRCDQSVRKISFDTGISTRSVSVIREELVQGGWIPEDFKKSGEKSGYIYAMKNESNGLVKLGYSGSPEIRRKEISEKQKSKISIIDIWEVSDMESAEKLLHLYFKKFNVCYEWFRLDTHCLSQKIDDLLIHYLEGAHE